MCFGLAVTFSQYVLVTFLVPFLPDFAADRGIGKTTVGLIMGADPLMTMFMSPLVGFKLVQSFGPVARSNCLPWPTPQQASGTL